MTTIESRYELAPIQKGMLFHHLLAEQSGVDIEQIVGTLREDLDISAFRKAWHRVVSRHAALRTGLRWKNLDAPCQEVRCHADLPLHTEDWRGCPTVEQDQRLARYLHSDRIRGFDLARPPLVRLGLFRVADTDYRLVWTLHHVVMDGRSFPLVIREVFAFYEAFRSDEDLELGPAPPFEEHIRWLAGRDRSGDEAFWRDLLRGFTSSDPLPLAAPPSGDDRLSDVREEQEIRLSRRHTDTLRSLAREHGLTLATLVYGAWAVLLSRYSHRERVVFYAVRAGRNSIPRSDSVVGVFINTVPVPVHVPPRARLIPWLKNLRRQQIAVRPFEQTALVDIQRWSEAPPGQPLSQSIVVFDHALLDSVLKRGKGTWSNREFRVLDKTSFPITLYAYGEPELLLSLVYDPREFSGAAVRRTLVHLGVVLEGIASDPTTEVGALPMLTDLERHRQLVDWNATATRFPADLCIHQLIEQQVRRTPDSIAVVYDGESITYRQLNARANGLARRLRQLGVGPEVLVGICLERSLEALVGLLGVLKAGGAYLPLDPDFPEDRLAFIMEDAGASVLLTQTRLLNQLPATQAEVVLVDDGRDAVSAEENDQCVTTSRNLAYVIYTSGSTGKPKGVMIEHRSVVNFFTGMNERVGHRPPETWLALTSLSFDISVLELLWTLTRGCRIVVGRDQSWSSASPSRRQPVDSEKFSVPALIRRHRVSAMQCTPSLARMLLADTETRAALRSLQTLLVGGEVLPVDLARELKELVSGDVLNMYGPTETTIWSSTQRVDRSKDTVPIGRPIANTQFFVLDRNGQPVPVGVTGELYIGGEGVARGYLRRPELTAERFVENPFRGASHDRLYRTGDMVRYRDDGTVEFLGRADHQVKIRGHRIELGEIEAVLSRHAAVREAVVVAGEDLHAGPSLVGYYVKQPGASVADDELKRACRKELPDYMVPAVFVGLNALPLTPNRKIDRRALPIPTQTPSKLAQAFVAPQTPTEKMLAQIWQATLGVERIGIHDDFFHLGGNSLSGVQITLKIRQTFNIELPLHAIFRTPTVAGLGELLAASLPSLLGVTTEVSIRTRPDSP